MTVVRRPSFSDRDWAEIEPRLPKQSRGGKSSGKPNHPAMWHAVAMVEQSFFERRYVADQAGPGLIARVVTQYDDVALYPPAYFHSTVSEVRSNPHTPVLLKAAHLFAGTWVEDNQPRQLGRWEANA